jgi:hypothetical protein
MISSSASRDVEKWGVAAELVLGERSGVAGRACLPSVLEGVARGPGSNAVVSRSKRWCSSFFDSKAAASSTKCAWKALAGCSALPIASNDHETRSRPRRIGLAKS